MKKSPKRRKDKFNPYTIISLNNKFFVKFIDSNNHLQYIEISKELYDTFDKFELVDLSQMNKYDRHIEHFNIDTLNLNKRAVKKNINLEKIIVKRSEYSSLYNAILMLPQKQKRRIILFYFYNYTQQEIANIENCSLRAVQYSLSIALKNLKKLLS